jgi:5-methylcytosine-specific restriction endonuclease McrA
MKQSSLRPVSKKQARLNRQRVPFRAQVLEEEPYCKACLEGCTHVAYEVHEICIRSRRGSILDRENVEPLCGNCHHFITTHPEWALHNGWMLHANPSPEDIETAKEARRALIQAG